MTNYATAQDLIDRIGAEPLALMADADMDGNENPLSVERALNDASALIDGALAPRWPEWQGVATPLLISVCVDLALGRLARGPARTTELVERAEAAGKTLDKIADGKIAPGPGAAVRPSGGGKAFASSGTRRMTRDSLGGVL